MSQVIKQTEFRVTGYCKGEKKMCKPGLKTEEQAKKVIQEHSELAKRYPRVYDFCDKYIITKREVVKEFGEWEEV